MMHPCSTHHSAASLATYVNQLVAISTGWVLLGPLPLPVCMQRGAQQDLAACGLWRGRHAA